MSRFTTALMIAVGALTGIASAQLLSGPPGNNPPPLPPPATPVVVRPPIPATPATVVAAAVPNAIVFDSESKDYNAKPGEASAAFTFMATNMWTNDIQINSLRTSCGCTVAQLPNQPYTLHPGSNVPINVTVDLRGKMGLITKSVSVDSTAGFKSLLVKVNIPQPTNAGPAVAAAGGPGMDRAKNIQASLADRQAVFKGNCVECHVQKGIGKMGKELYTADCGVCHDDEHRAAMVPDLKVPRSHRDIAFFKKWIEEGKAGTLMPAFATAQGGPLSQEQIDSLVVYLYQTLPKDPPMQQAQGLQLPPSPATLVPQKN